MQAVALTTPSTNTYTSTANMPASVTSFNATPQQDSFSSGKTGGPQFGIIDGGCCSGPCAIGCAALIGIPLLIAIKPLKLLGRLWNALLGAGKTLGAQIK